MRDLNNLLKIVSVLKYFKNIDNLNKYHKNKTTFFIFSLIFCLQFLEPLKN